VEVLPAIKRVVLGMPLREVTVVRLLTHLQTLAAVVVAVLVQSAATGQVPLVEMVVQA
jgi:hypothetical protein